jgi:hypothetical protein
MIGRLSRALFAGLVLIQIGCGDSGPERKKVIPVMGVVHVDGKPAELLTVTFTDDKGVDKDLPTYSSALTDTTGKFVGSTYEKGDGLPEGTYTLTFTWGTLNVFSKTFEGDKLNERYDDPAKSQQKVTVQGDEPIDLGTIELTSK